MPIKCKKGEKKTCRIRKIKGGSQRLCGCKTKTGRFKVKEVKTMKKGKKSKIKRV